MVSPVVTFCVYPPEVLVPLKVNVAAPQVIVRVPVPVLLQPLLPNVTLLAFVAKSIVPFIAFVVKLLMLKFVLTTIVPPFRPPAAPSIVTSSLAPGTDAPLPVPLLVDQFVVLEASHVPEPPTQNLAAMCQPLLVIQVDNESGSSN